MSLNHQLLSTGAVTSSLGCLSWIRKGRGKNMTIDHNKPVKIAVVGDIHDQWEVEDAIALQHLGVSLVLFVGDFGNES
jgi:hypothetical protein